VRQQLLDARNKDPQVQLWPEVAADIIGADYQRDGDMKNAIEIFQLNLLAYPPLLTRTTTSPAPIWRMDRRSSRACMRRRLCP
jgi:hypothetical protein